MKKILAVLVASLVLLTAVHSGLAQQGGLLFIIQGTPDAASNPPQVRTYLSVINESTAKSIQDLQPGDFQLKEAGTKVGPLDVSYEPVGLGVVVVVDRGGIAAPGDSRIGEAADLVRELIDKLTIAGAQDDDIIALVGVNEEGVNPEVNFTYNPVDTNLVKNALTKMEGETVRGTSPLYEGLDKGLRLLTKNSDAEVRDVLAHRRKLLIVFSDGIDPDYSDEAREQDIIRKAENADISIYTVGMAHRRLGKAAEDNLEQLASQTQGLYRLHNDNEENHKKVLELFDRLMTQRNQYLLTYETRQPKGDYTLEASVSTDVGSAEDSVTLSSVLEVPQIELTSPSDGSSYTVPYSKTLGSFEKVTIPFRSKITPVDGASRMPSEVRYFVNGIRVGAGTSPPDFPFDMNLSGYITPTGEAETRDFTVFAEAKDLYLGQQMQSDESNVTVTWEPEELPLVDQSIEWLSTNWWLLLILGALAIGLLVLLVMLIRTRGRLGEAAQQAVSSTTQALKGVTRRLGAQSRKAPGKLVITQGANVGKEFRLATQVVKVGRDPQFCDLALYDEFVSNPHFSIRMEQQQFYITDEGSTNGTQLNGRSLQPHQRVALQPDAVIEAGQTKLQFKRLGGPTRKLSGQQGGASGGQAGAQQSRRGGPTKQVPPPSQGG